MLIIGIALLLSVGCSKECCEIKSNIPEANHYVSSAEAIEIATHFKAGKTRDAIIDPDLPTYFCILSDESGKIGSSAPDTLAHVLNYNNDRGFVIVAADNRVCPILAYSEVGNFNPTNAAVREFFIDKLTDYYNDTRYHAPISFSDGEFFILVEPWVKTILHGNAPFNKYWTLRHPQFPNSPIGCVSVASTIVLMNSTPSFTYQGFTYNSAQILQELRRFQLDPEISVQNTEIGTSYEIAVDHMARFMDAFCYAIGSTAYENVTSGIGSNAHQEMQNFNLEVSDYLHFDVDTMGNYLLDNYLLFIDLATFPFPGLGHAIVADGLAVEYYRETDHYSPYLFHIDWGWNGDDNGFYCAPVFGSDSQQQSYRLTEFFAVKRTVSISL